MPATFEFWPLGGAIRLGPEHHELGDPYTIGASIRGIEPQAYEVCALDQPITPSQWRQIKQAARQHGIRWLLFRRVDPAGNVRHEKWVRVK